MIMLKHLPLLSVQVMYLLRKNGLISNNSLELLECYYLYLLLGCINLQQTVSFAFIKSVCLSLLHIGQKLMLIDDVR